MSLWALFVTHSLVILVFFLAAPSLSDARPLDARTPPVVCKVFGRGEPCLCDGKFGLAKQLRDFQKDCPSPYMGYAYPGDPSDANLTAIPYVGKRPKGVQCDHIVSPTFVANMIKNNEQKFCGQPQCTQAFQDLSELIHAPENKINLLQEIKAYVKDLRNGGLPRKPKSKPLKGAIVYLQVLTYFDALDSPRPFGYYRARTAARAIGDFLGNMISDNEYGAAFDTAYLTQLKSGIRRGQAKLKMPPSVSETGGPEITPLPVQ